MVQNREKCIRLASKTLESNKLITVYWEDLIRPGISPCVCLGGRRTYQKGILDSMEVNKVTEKVSI